MRVNKRFKVGCLYYQCGIALDLNGHSVPFVETVVYMGFAHKPGWRNDQCDEPEYYYHFKDWKPGLAHLPPDKWGTTGVYVPSLKQAMMTRLTWKQLMAYGLPRLLKELAENDRAMRESSRDSATREPPGTGALSVP